MTTHSSIPAWEVPWTEEPGGLQSVGSQRVAHGWALLPHRITYQNTKVCIKVVIQKQLYQPNKNPKLNQTFIFSEQFTWSAKTEEYTHIITKIQSAKAKQWETLWTNNTVYATKRLMGKKKSQYLRAN